MRQSAAGIALASMFGLTACAASSPQTIPLANINAVRVGVSARQRTPAFLTFAVQVPTDKELGRQPGLCPAGEYGFHGPDLRWAMCNLPQHGRIVFDTKAMERNSPQSCANGTCRILLSAPLPPLGTGHHDLYTIDGGGTVILDEQNRYRAFWIGNAYVTLENIEIDNAAAIGGAGGHNGGGGGGGAGAGGGVFVYNGFVHLKNVYFLNNRAAGGDGGHYEGLYFAGGGGGGLDGAGGNGQLCCIHAPGGGGGGGVLVAGGNAILSKGGVGGYDAGGGGSGARWAGGDAGRIFPGGGTSGSAGDPAARDVRGVWYSGAGGSGGFGGGGGGGGDAGCNDCFPGGGGNGGFLGGGGGGGDYLASTRFGRLRSIGRGGAGGPGGGGGGGALHPRCHGCVGGGGLGGTLVDVAGGNGGLDGGGGGGAAAGPVIFNYFGIVEITNSGATGSSAVPGHGFSAQGGMDGTADATPIFNYGGYVNGAGAQGPISGILLPRAPSVQR